MEHRDRGGRGGMAVGGPGVERPDARQDAEAHVEGEEDPGLQAAVELDSLHLEEGKGRRARGDVEGKDAHEDEGRPEEQVQGQLHRRVLLGAHAGPPQRPSKDSLRPDLSRRPPDPDQEVHGEHGDLVEEEEHEEVEGDEDAVHARDEHEEERVELLAALLDRPGGEDAREDDDAGEQHHEEAHAVHAHLVVDAQRRHQGQLLVELEERHVGLRAIEGPVDAEREHERGAGGEEGEPADEEGPVAREEHDEHGAEKGRPGDDREHGDPHQRGQRIQTRRAMTPSAMP